MPRRREGEYTETEKKILNVLKDGKPHVKAELLLLLLDGELSNTAALSMMISRLRKKLNKRGQTIDCVVSKGEYRYRQCILLQDEDER